MNKNVKNVVDAATTAFLAGEWPLAIELARLSLALQMPPDQRFKVTGNLAAALQFNANGRIAELREAIALYDDLLVQAAPDSRDWLSLQRRLGSAWSRLAEATQDQAQRRTAFANVITYYEAAARDSKQSAALRASIATALGDAYSALRDVNPTYADRAVEYLSGARQVFVDLGLEEEVEQVTRSLASLSSTTFALSAELQTAVDSSELARVRDLLARGADPNACDDDGCSILQRAVSGGHQDIAKLLVSYGANRFHRDNDDFTLLHWAVFSNEPELLELAYIPVLGVDPADVDGRTPLSWAVSEGWHHSIAWLLEHSSDPDRSDNDGWTALHYAVASGQADALSILVSAGANRQLRSSAGELPIDLAQRLEEHQAVLVLEQMDAEPR